MSDGLLKFIITTVMCVAKTSNGRELITDLCFDHVFILVCAFVLPIVIIYSANTDSSQCPTFCNTFYPLKKLSRKARVRLKEA